MKKALFSPMIYALVVSLLFLPLDSYTTEEEDVRPIDERYFTLENGLNLRDFGSSTVKRLLTRVRGRGQRFGTAQEKQYCELMDSPGDVQWTLMDLDSGEMISRSPNAGDSFFGASSSKLFVAAALLDKQGGRFTKAQLKHLVKIIVVSDNSSWKELQRQAGDDGTDDAGRIAVERFTQKMGYVNTRGFQGWLTRKDGTRTHGNELNTMELAQFLYDTYHRKYKGAETLWKIMFATKTGKNKINKYTPASIYIGGKTGTYHGPNESPDTIRFDEIKARNHVAVLNIGNRYFGLSILSNTGKDEDVAVLAGGLMREWLHVEAPVNCESAARRSKTAAGKKGSQSKIEYRIVSFYYMSKKPAEIRAPDMSTVFDDHNGTP